MSIEILGVDVDTTPRFVQGEQAQLVDLLAGIAKKHDITVHRVKYGGRTRVLVKIRREFVRVARGLGYSFPKIGWALGCHHASAINLVYGAGAKKDRPRREMKSLEKV